MHAETKIYKKCFICPNKQVFVIYYFLFQPGGLWRPKNNYDVLEKNLKILSYLKFYDDFTHMNFKILGLIDQFLKIPQKNIGVWKILKFGNISTI